MYGELGVSGWVGEQSVHLVDSGWLMGTVVGLSWIAGMLLLFGLYTECVLREFQK